VGETDIRAMVSDEELLRRQDALQAEARRVLDDLDLIRILNEIGHTTVVGSVVLGLMVWRDIDIEVQIKDLTADLAFGVARTLVSEEGVYRLVYHDWTGLRSDPSVPKGYYLGVRYQPQGREEWKLDIWLLPEGSTYRTGGPLVESMLTRLTPETRLAILRLKDIWCHLPTYRKEVLSTDIYDAVLEQGVRTPAELDRYLEKRDGQGR
jgi:hypothetical protein